MKKHYSWQINPDTGDYLTENGSPMRDETLNFPAYVRIKTPRKGWLYAPNKDYGSDFNLLNKRTNATRKLLETVSTKALQPLIDDGRATQIEFASLTSENYTETNQAIIYDKEQNPSSIDLQPVGI